MYFLDYSLQRNSIQMDNNITLIGIIRDTKALKLSVLNIFNSTKLCVGLEGLRTGLVDKNEPFLNMVVSRNSISFYNDLLKIGFKDDDSNIESYHFKVSKSDLNTLFKFVKPTTGQIEIYLHGNNQVEFKLGDKESFWFPISNLKLLNSTYQWLSDILLSDLKMLKAMIQSTSPYINPYFYQGMGLEVTPEGLELYSKLDQSFIYKAFKMDLPATLCAAPAYLPISSSIKSAIKLLSKGEAQIGLSDFGFKLVQGDWSVSIKFVDYSHAVIGKARLYDKYKTMQYSGNDQIESLPDKVTQSVVGEFSGSTNYKPVGKVLDNLALFELNNWKFAIQI